MTKARIGVFNHGTGELDDQVAATLGRAQLDALGDEDLDVLVSTGVGCWLDDDRRQLHRAARRLNLHPLTQAGEQDRHAVIMWVNLDRIEVLSEHHVDGGLHGGGHLRAQVLVEGVIDPIWLVAAHAALADQFYAGQFYVGDLARWPAVVAGTFADDHPTPAVTQCATHTPSHAPGDTPGRTPAHAVTGRLPVHEVEHAGPSGAGLSVAGLLDWSGFTAADTLIPPAPPQQFPGTAGAAPAEPAARWAQLPGEQHRGAGATSERIFLSEPLNGALLRYEQVTNTRLEFGRRAPIAVLDL